MTSNFSKAIIFLFLIVAVSLLIFYTTLLRYLVFQLTVIILLPMVFVFFFKQQKWHILLSGLLVIFVILLLVVSYTDNYFLSKSSTIVIGKINKKKITIRYKFQIKYSYTINDFSHTQGTTISPEFSKNIGKFVLLKVSNDRPWINEIIYSADSIFINKILDDKTKTDDQIISDLMYYNMEKKLQRSKKPRTRFN